MKKIMFKIMLFITVFLFSFSVKAEDLIRYTTRYEIPIQNSEYKPSTEDMQEWWNIDLPRDENNNPIYTLEFNIDNVDFSTIGEYDVVLTFYKTEDKQFQKTFKLNVIEKQEEIKTEETEKIEYYFIRKIIIVVVLGILFYILIQTLLKLFSKRSKYVILYNNKVIKIIKSRKIPELNKIKKILKNKTITSFIILNKEDLPKYIEEMVKNKKCDYVIELKK